MDIWLVDASEIMPIYMVKIGGTSTWSVFVYWRLFEIVSKDMGGFPARNYLPSSLSWIIFFLVQEAVRDTCHIFHLVSYTTNHFSYVQVSCEYF